MKILKTRKNKNVYKFLTWKLKSLELLNNLDYQISKFEVKILIPIYNIIGYDWFSVKHKKAFYPQYSLVYSPEINFYTNTNRGYVLAQNPYKNTMYVFIPQIRRVLVVAFNKTYTISKNDLKHGKIRESRNFEIKKLRKLLDK